MARKKSPCADLASASLTSCASCGVTIRSQPTRRAAHDSKASVKFVWLPNQGRREGRLRSLSAHVIVTNVLNRGIERSSILFRGFFVVYIRQAVIRRARGRTNLRPQFLRC